MTNSTKTTKYSSIFLAAILVAGTITTFFPSFMVGTAQAAPYPDMDREKKEEKKNVSVNSLKCNNINVNINGLELDVFPPFLGGDDSQAPEAVDDNIGASSFAGNRGSDEESVINDFRFICINNNNNTVIQQQPSEIVTCEECFSILNETQITRLLLQTQQDSIEALCEFLDQVSNSSTESNVLFSNMVIIGIPTDVANAIIDCLVDTGVIDPRQAD